MTDYEALREAFLNPSEPDSGGGIERASFSFWQDTQNQPQTFSEQCIHEWEHEPHRAVSVCSLCGVKLTELDHYRGLGPSLREVYNLASNPPKVNTGAMVAAAWESFVGKDPMASAFSQFWPESDIVPQWDEPVSSAIDREGKIYILNRNTYELLGGARGGGKTALLASARKKLLNQMVEGAGK